MEELNDIKIISAAGRNITFNFQDNLIKITEENTKTLLFLKDFQVL